MGDFIKHGEQQRAWRDVENAGAGVAGSHRIISNAAPFIGNAREFVVAIDIYTDGTKFTDMDELWPDGETRAKSAASKDPGGNGYPHGCSPIVGKFINIKPTGDAIVAGYVVRI